MALRRPTRRNVLLTATTALASAAVGGTPAAGDSARITAAKWLDPRTFDLTVASPAVGASLPVRVVTPTGYATHPDRTWPVLYLLHGAHDDYTSWTRETDVSDFLAGRGVLVVMPSSGPTGIPTDWWNYGMSGAPDYERFQVDEVMALLRQHFRANGRRAVAGVSTGGYGALAFAARRPGVFGAAASYSGILDTTAPGMPTVAGAIVARESLAPLALWGSALFNRDNWNQHNAYALAGALAGTGLYIAQGSGLPSSDFGNLEGAVLEGTLWSQAHWFTRRLDALGIPAQVHFYNGGSHAWPYWQQEFKASWPTLAAGLGPT
ncbi:alpha/beta hydrolase [Streptomyces sp. NPDC050564]|uniref:alpha/beta hydrolase n=1 Tax=Streptomyces sp. NPDC050564 TaxID=3365631 RepID=UPI0037B3FD23